jgi:hypothetical protein
MSARPDPAVSTATAGLILTPAFAQKAGKASFAINPSVRKSHCFSVSPFICVYGRILIV